MLHSAFCELQLRAVAGKRVQTIQKKINLKRPVFCVQGTYNRMQKTRNTQNKCTQGRPEWMWWAHWGGQCCQIDRIWIQLVRLITVGRTVFAVGRTIPWAVGSGLHNSEKTEHRHSFTFHLSDYVQVTACFKFLLPALPCHGGWLLEVSPSLLRLLSSGCLITAMEKETKPSPNFYINLTHTDTRVHACTHACAHFLVCYFYVLDCILIPSSSLPFLVSTHSVTQVTSHAFLYQFLPRLVSVFLAQSFAVTQLIHPQMLRSPDLSQPLCFPVVPLNHFSVFTKVWLFFCVKVHIP